MIFSATFMEFHYFLQILKLSLNVQMQILNFLETYQVGVEHISLCKSDTISLMSKGGTMV